jgi:hypothetical protein
MPTSPTTHLRGSTTRPAGNSQKPMLKPPAPSTA